VSELTVSIPAAVPSAWASRAGCRHDGSAWAGPLRGRVWCACRPIGPGDLASCPARDAVVPSSRVAKRILISAIQVAGCHGVSDGRANGIGDFGETRRKGARAAARLREPAGCGSRRKKARAGGIVVMNVLNLYRHVQARNDHRATAIGLIVASGSSVLACAWWSSRRPSRPPGEDPPPPAPSASIQGSAGSRPRGPN